MDGNLDQFISIWLILKDKNPKCSDGNTPLHFAIVFNNIDIVKFIIRKIMDKNPQDNTGWTPLHSAARFGRLDILKIILDYIEDKNPWCCSHYY